MSRKILLIEDNRQSVVFVGKWLLQAGFEFASATSGEEGLEQAIQVMPDLILLDIDLPDINGVEIAKRLRATQGFERTCFVAYTANVRRVDREYYLANGFDAHLGKPITQRELVDTVTQLLNP
jgi:two-component system, cell cycle response regulator DivK